MTARRHSAVTYARIKSAFRRVVHAAGGQESAAMATRVAGHQTIGRYLRPHEPHFAPVDIVADLEADTGCPDVTRVLADLAGCILIPKPPTAGDAQWARELGALAKECGEALGRLGEAFSAGGRITADEIRELDLCREVAEAMEALAAIETHLKHELERDE